MATPTTEIRIPNFAWKALDFTVKTLVRAINANRPLEGGGIRLSSTEAGTLIECGPSGGDAGVPHWVTINVLKSEPKQQPDGSIAEVQLVYKLNVWAQSEPFDPIPCDQFMAAGSAAASQQ